MKKYTLAGPATLAAVALLSASAAADPITRVATTTPALTDSAARPAASADDGGADDGTDAPAPPTRRHAIYLEGMGRGGLGGLGYGYQLDRRWGVGAVASFNLVDGQRLYSLSPFVTLYPVGGGARHRWFVEAGPHLARLVTPSPVPEWSGTSSNGIGGQLASGYEYRHGVLVRVFGMVEAGRGGVAPWFGVALGWTL
ncbi:MAG: hypothetical protein IPL61_21040 [Myxococcales bacterium]|nr:hypothetical protein [Myxococcales bacterium]